MKSALLVLFTCLSIPTFSQLAIDFTVTDSEGNEHTLYEDYLDLNKSVVLKVFFTTCPPCRSIAPDFQQLYEDWGAGNGDVEFIELSNKTFDHDQNVQSYKGQFGLTMPSAGVDGGSIAVVNTYTSGTYGPFTGTPLFIVISPDGTVNYDVFGSGNAGTIANLHAAIEASREIIIPDPPLFSARIADLDQNALTQDLTLIAEPLAGAPSDLEPQTFLLTADQEGVYTLEEELLDQSEFYTARLSYGEDLDPAAGLSILDLIRIQRHILGISPFTSVYQSIASDATFDNAVNVLDLLKIQQIILTLDMDLGYENYVITNECHRLTQSFNFSDLIQSNCPAEFVMFKLGDLSPF